MKIVRGIEFIQSKEERRKSEMFYGWVLLLLIGEMPTNGAKLPIPSVGAPAWPIAYDEIFEKNEKAEFSTEGLTDYVLSQQIGSVSVREILASLSKQGESALDFDVARKIIQMAKSMMNGKTQKESSSEMLTEVNPMITNGGKNDLNLAENKFVDGVSSTNTSSLDRGMLWIKFKKNLNSK